MADKPNKTRQYRGRNISNRIYAYNNSSSAYAYDFESSLQTRQKRVRGKKLKRGTREVFIKAIDKSARPSIWVYATIFVIASSIALCVTLHSLAATQALRNHKLRDELKTMQSRTSELTVLASQNMDLGEIERIARTKLEMSEPQIHQIVYINVPKQNYTVHIQEASDTSLQKADMRLGDFFKNFFAED